MRHIKNKKLYTLITFIAIGGVLFTGCQKSGNESKNGENVGVNTSQNMNEMSSNKTNATKNKNDDFKNKEDASANKNEEAVTEEPEGEIKTLKGTVKEGMLQTIIILGEDNNVYQFEKNDEKIETGESGILIGNPITVKYKGELDPNSNAQDVEIISMTVEDAE